MITLRYKINSNKLFELQSIIFLITVAKSSIEIPHFFFKRTKEVALAYREQSLKKIEVDKKRGEKFEAKQNKKKRESAKNRAGTHALLSTGVQAALAGHGNGNGRGPAAVSGERLARRVKRLPVLRLALGQEHVDGQRRRILRRRALRR